MKMGIVTAIIYIHMLLWAGCNATPSAHKLGSDEILLKKAQPIKVFWRKLLQENTSKPDLIKVETTNASIETESNSVDVKDAHMEIADVKKENAVLDANIETPKTDSASSITKQEEVNGESVAVLTSTQNDATNEEEPKIQEASKEEVSSEPTDKDTHTTEAKKIENTDNSTSEAIAQSQDEERSTPSTNEDDAKVSEKGVETEENAQQISLQNVKEEDSGQTEEKQVQIVLVKEETPGEKTDVEENKNASNVDTQNKLLEEEVSAVAVVEEDKGDSTPEQKDATPGDVKSLEGDHQQETPTEETGNVVKSTETEEEPTEDNPIKMVEGDSDEKQTDLNDDAKIKMVQSSEPEGDDKEQIALGSPASVKEQDSSNSTDDSNGETGNSSDIKVDDEKIEEKHESSDDKENNTTEEVSQVKSEETVEEKHETNDDNTEPKESENKDTEVVLKSEEKAEENHEPSGENTEVKDKEGEGEEVSQVKSEEKAEENHEPSGENTEVKDKEGEGEEVSQVKSEEKAEENHEPSGENTEVKDKEGEGNDTEEVLQVKSEEKAEENHEPSGENTEVKDKEGEGNDAEEVSQVKTDDETQAAVKEVESQLEALKRDTVFDTTNDQRQESDPSDDEYDIIQEIADLPTKFQETAEKVADHLRPDLLRWSDTSKEYFNLANQQISASFSPLIGRQYAPFFASMISYGILLLPLIVVILLFEHIKALFSLQKVLLFINIYLAAYFATLWLASFIIGLEPMSFFYHNSLSSYLSLQLLQALGYVVYLILQTANIINSCTSADTRVGKVTSGLQWVVALGIGLHYYVTVFHPAVASKPPHTSWKFYAIYSAAFLILCLFARIRWVKKQYVSSGNAMANKKS